MTNCPRCNAKLVPSRISCTKCGIIYRSRVPKKLLKREKAVKALDNSGALEHHKIAAKAALDQERLRHGL